MILSPLTTQSTAAPQQAKSADELLNVAFAEFFVKTAGLEKALAGSAGPGADAFSGIMASLIAQDLAQQVRFLPEGAAQ